MQYLLTPEVAKLHVNSTASSNYGRSTSLLHLSLEDGVVAQRLLFGQCERNTDVFRSHGVGLCRRAVECACHTSARVGGGSKYLRRRLAFV